MSAILFNIVMENLSQVLHFKEAYHDLNTYVMGDTKLKIHLLFTQRRILEDDILIFTKANHKSFTLLHQLLGEFLTFSNLEISSNKSSIIFSMSCEKV